MVSDKWFVEFVAADPQKRKTMLRGKDKKELVRLASYFRVDKSGNTVNLINTLTHKVRRLPA